MTVRRIALKGVFKLRTPLGLLFAQRIWQGGAGIITVLILTHTLSLEAQGQYYSFQSFASLYTLFDLGLSLVLVQMAAHSSVVTTGTGINPYEEAESRVSALIAFGVRYYAWLAIAFLIVVFPLGWLFFSAFAPVSSHWRLIWIALSIAVALSLLTIPVLAVFEGRGEVTAVAGVRFTQIVIGSVATWGLLIGGGGIWAIVMMPAATFICGVTWIVLRHSSVFLCLTVNPRPVNWKAELWPLQWRVGLSWFSGYILTQVHTLILFSTQGSAEAGQMGLSMTIGNMIGLFAQSFIVRHVPDMAKAVARRNWDKFDDIFRKDFSLSCAFFLAAAGAAIGLAEILSYTKYGTRILPIIPFSGLLLAVFLGHICGALAYKLRSYRREPLVWVSTAGAVGTLILVLPAAHAAGAGGIVAVILTVQAIIVLPLSLLMFFRCDRAWRSA